jgi:hypothetical protein
MNRSLNTPVVVRGTLDEAIQSFGDQSPSQSSGECIKLAVLGGDNVLSVLSARIVAQQLGPMRIYLPKSFHAFLEMDPWASTLRDVSDLVHFKASGLFRSTKSNIKNALVEPLALQGVNCAVLLGGETLSDTWGDPAIAELLCQGLDRVWTVQDMDIPFDSSNHTFKLQSPPLQAGAQSLARATLDYRSKSPSMLKALVFLSAEAWLGKKPEVSKQLVSWLEDQQATAQRLKLGLDISRLCFGVSDRLAQRQLNDSVSALQTCNWADLLGYLAYADLIATDHKELIHVARCLGKTNVNLL